MFDIRFARFCSQTLALEITRPSTTTPLKQILLQRNAWMACKERKQGTGAEPGAGRGKRRGRFCLGLDGGDEAGGSGARHHHVRVSPIRSERKEQRRRQELRLLLSGWLPAAGLLLFDRARCHDRHAIISLLFVLCARYLSRLGSSFIARPPIKASRPGDRVVLSLPVCFPLRQWRPLATYST